jgi:predicted DNA repair protein MutK
MGTLLVRTLPIIIKAFAIIGTIALILVSGGIFAHNLDFLHHVLPSWPAMLKEFTIGTAGGLLVLLLIGASKKIIAMAKK